MGIQITADFLKQLEMTESEFLIEMAVHFYDIGKMSMGQARNFANLDQISFQKEMSKRNVYIKYDLEDLEEDMRTLEIMDELENRQNIES
jgi:predicted HTH domain antitoxin